MKFLRTAPALPVKDIGEAIPYYERALGFKAEFVNEGVEGAVYAACTGRILRKIENSPYGLRDFTMADLDGNVILMGQ